MDVASGAYTSTFAAASLDVRKEADRYYGGFLVPMGKLTPPAAIAQNDELAQELWDTTERFNAEWEL